MDQNTFILRGIAERLKLQTVRELAMLPDVRDVYRVTIHYPDMRAKDTIATLLRDSLNEVVLEVIHYGHFNNRPIRYDWNIKRYKSFMSAFRPASFDKLYDQTINPTYSEDLCLIERGAGGFVKSVICVPQRVDGEYARIMTSIKEFMPEVVREIT